MDAFARAASRLIFISLVLVCGSAALFAPRLAQALPAACTTSGNFCTAPLTSPWTYSVSPGYSFPNLGPFDSRQEAIDATVAVGLNGTGWCSVTPDSPSVTFDDGYGWATPQYVGSLDVFHANTIHLTVVGYNWGSNQCTQSWGWAPTLLEQRQVYCPAWFNLVYDTSVTPNVPFCQSAQTSWQPAKVPCPTCNNGNHLMKGNLVDVPNQNKQEVVVDYQGAGTSPVRMVRTYNTIIGWTHTSDFVDAVGFGWSATYFQRLLQFSVNVGGTTYSTVYAFRPTGQMLPFNLVSGQWVSTGADISDTLTSISGGGFEYRTANDMIETYDSSGRLLSIKQPGKPDQTLSYTGTSRLPDSVSTAFGETLTFGYTAVGGKRRLTSITDPSGAQITYHYTQQWNSTVVHPDIVTYQDGKTRIYGYDQWDEWNLLSITDEAGVPYASWTYTYYGPYESQHSGGVDHYSFSYNFGSGFVVVTDPRSTQHWHYFTTIHGVRVLTASGPSCAGCPEEHFRTYDANGNVATREDFNGNQTHYAFDLTRNLETSRTEAYGTSLARTITTTWHSTWRKPALVTEPNRTTAHTYDANGNVLTRTITDTTVTPNVSRVWTYTYDSYNRVLTEDGPRTDVSDTTTYAYYGPSATCSATVTGATATGCRGQLNTVTNALSQVTTFDEYNAYGRPVKMTDANGLVTTLVYDARQRLTSRTVGGETTTILYWPTGLIKKVTLPDSSYVQYTYDNAHRLYKIEDGDGNRVEYTLDNSGNRTAENAYDPSSALSRTHSRVFNSLNLLWKDVNAAGTSAVTTVFGYDDQGNQTSIAAPLSRNTANQYDELNRLKQITDPASGGTQFGYDANDNLTSVSDPRAKVTSYTYNGFGDLTQQVSPDTGTTGNTYDSGGNLATSTDARSKTGTYSYDALNRVTSIAHTDLTTSFTYDSGTNGAGRLTGASDANHSLSWTYDAQGHVTGESQTVGAVTKSVSYGYTNGNLTSLTTPSGQTIAYGYSNGRIASVTLNGSTTILNQVLYEPFGPVAGWTWGNTTIAARVYDTDGKPSNLDSAGAYTYGYDDAFRITSIADVADSSKSWTYGYDALDRLNSASKTGQTIGYTYDANGNRLTQTGTQSATYTISSSNNRITSISGTPTRTYSYDAGGSTTGDGTLTFAYRDNGRMSSVTSGGVTTSYVMNALGQRVKKSNASLTRLFVYDEASHLLGEYDATGALVQETVWMGDIPVATLRPNGASVTLYYVHTDHLNTPRRISRPSDNAVLWRWDSDPFGTTAANEDPDSDSTLFSSNLRFPGQYFDAESGLNYNYFRDYDPAVGRYIESDPIGLEGSLNTYAYVGGNPLSYSDLTGLAPPGRTQPGTGFPALGIPGPFDESWNRARDAAALKFEEWFNQAVNTVKNWCSDDEDDGTMLAEQETLTAEEEAAIRAKAAGKPYDQATYNRARQKQIKNEKYNKERNKRKRDG